MGLDRASRKPLLVELGFLTYVGFFVSFWAVVIDCSVGRDYLVRGLLG